MDTLSTHRSASSHNLRSDIAALAGCLVASTLPFLVFQPIDPKLVYGDPLVLHKNLLLSVPTTFLGLWLGLRAQKTRASVAAFLVIALGTLALNLAFERQWNMAAAGVWLAQLLTSLVIAFLYSICLGKRLRTSRHLHERSASIGLFHLGICFAAAALMSTFVEGIRGYMLSHLILQTANAVSGATITTLIAIFVFANASKVHPRNRAMATLSLCLLSFLLAVPLSGLAIFAVSSMTDLNNALNWILEHALSSEFEFGFVVSILSTSAMTAWFIFNNLRLRSFTIKPIRQRRRSSKWVGRTFLFAQRLFWSFALSLVIGAFVFGPGYSYETTAIFPRPNWDHYHFGWPMTFASESVDGLHWHANALLINFGVFLALMSLLFLIRPLASARRLALGCALIFAVFSIAVKFEEQQAERSLTLQDDYKKLANVSTRRTKSVTKNPMDWLRKIVLKPRSSTADRFAIEWRVEGMLDASVMELLQAINPTEATFIQCEIGHDAFSALKCQSDLQRLTLEQCTFDNLASLSVLSDIPNLQTLSLSATCKDQRELDSLLASNAKDLEITINDSITFENARELENLTLVLESDNESKISLRNMPDLKTIHVRPNSKLNKTPKVVLKASNAPKLYKFSSDLEQTLHALTFDKTPVLGVIQAKIETLSVSDSTRAIDLKADLTDCISMQLDRSYLASGDVTFHGYNALRLQSLPESVSRNLANKATERRLEFVDCEVDKNFMADILKQTPIALCFRDCQFEPDALEALSRNLSIETLACDGAPFTQTQFDRLVTQASKLQSLSLSGGLLTKLTLPTNRVRSLKVFNAVNIPSFDISKFVSLDELCVVDKASTQNFDLTSWRSASFVVCARLFPHAENRAINSPAGLPPAIQIDFDGPMPQEDFAWKIAFANLEGASISADDLARLKKLTWGINFSNSDLNIASLGTFLDGSSIYSVYLDNVDPEADLPAFPSHMHFQTLSLRGRKIDQQDAERLSKIPGVTLLDLSDCRITPDAKAILLDLSGDKPHMTIRGLE